MKKRFNGLQPVVLVSLAKKQLSALKGGAHGGMILLYPTHLHIHFVQKQLIDGCGWFAVHWTFENFDLVIVATYFKRGEGIQGPNTLLWSGLMTFVTGLAKPVIAIGDFNITPEEFMATTMSTVMQVSNC